MSRKRRLLWVGDAACQTGFARCTHEILRVLHETWNIAVLGLNYRGDPHEDAYPFDPIPTYPIWPAPAGGDWLGLGRILSLIKKVEPDLMIIQNDPWNVPHYIRKGLPEELPLIGVMAVDGKNCRGDYLNSLDASIFWTEFALNEARAGGYEKPGEVIPLGVDAEFWTPPTSEERDAARKKLYGRDYEELKDAFILLNVNRNNPRKRMDLTLRYFAKWIKGLPLDFPDDAIRSAPVKITNAFLHLHVAPTGDTTGYDCGHLATYYGINDQVIVAQMSTWNGVNDETLRSIYHAADLGISTTQGEGWGLPAMEGMACGLPQVLPDWSAYAEWARQGTLLVPCTSTAATWASSVIGGVPDEEMFIEAVNRLYLDRDQLSMYRLAAKRLVQEPEYRWRAIGERYRDTLDAFMAAHVSVEKAPMVEVGR
jgi:D-inositol-3-phosphate glycosyltransferase